MRFNERLVRTPPAPAGRRESASSATETSLSSAAETARPQLRAATLLPRNENSSAPRTLVEQSAIHYGHRDAPAVPPPSTHSDDVDASLPSPVCPSIRGTSYIPHYGTRKDVIHTFAPRKSPTSRNFENRREAGLGCLILSNLWGIRKLNHFAVFMIIHHTQEPCSIFMHARHILITASVSLTYDLFHDAGNDDFIW